MDKVLGLSFLSAVLLIIIILLCKLLGVFYHFEKVFAITGFIVYSSSMLSLFYCIAKPNSDRRDKT